jgi:hypothetical protein
MKMRETFYETVEALAAKGNPQARNLFDIIGHLQEREGVHFELRTVR